MIYTHLISLQLSSYFISLLINMTYLSLMSRSPNFCYVFCKGLFPPWATMSTLTLLLNLSLKYHRFIFFSLGWPLKSLCFMWPYLLSFLMYGILLLPIITTLQYVLIDDWSYAKSHETTRKPTSLGSLLWSRGSSLPSSPTL